MAKADLPGVKRCPLSRHCADVFRCPLLTQSGHAGRVHRSPFSGVERHWLRRMVRISHAPRSQSRQKDLPGSWAQTVKFIERTAAIWRPLAAELDFATQQAYVRINKSNPGPSGEDAEVSANLARSDHICAKAHGSADIRAQRFPSS